MHLQPATILSLAVIVVCLHFSDAVAADKDDFIDFSSEGLPGRLYVPPEAEESARPVILFLHGAGETGSNNLSQINVNINNLLAAAKERGAFLYAPQATTVVGGIHNWNDTSRTANVMTMTGRVLAEQHADSNRLYVTGLSMGGGGAWNMASRYSDRFAAVVPIAGVDPAGDFDPAILVGKPTWAFHARNDSIVPKNISRNVINDILSSAGESTLTFPPDNDRNTTVAFVDERLQLSYTEFPGGDHFIWNRVYDTPEVYDWMFSHAVPEPSSFSMLMFATCWLAISARRYRTGQRGMRDVGFVYDPLLRIARERRIFPRAAANNEAANSERVRIGSV